MILLPYLTTNPRIGARLEAAATAAVLGRVQLGDDCHLGELTTLRADGEDVRIGNECWFDDWSTVHIADRMYPSIVGNHVSIGRFALVHACTVGDDCVFGDHAVMMDASTLGAGSVLAAGAVVPPGKTLQAGMLYAGCPAQAVRRIEAAELARLHAAVRTRQGPGADTVTVLTGESAGPMHQAAGTGVQAARVPHAYIAPSASIAGRVELANDSSVWFGVELDAGAGRIEIGENTNLQDNTRLHVAGKDESISIARNVTVGHNVRIHACVIEQDAMIGMGCVVSPGTIVRAGACVSAGAVTRPGAEISAGMIWAGNPARPSRPVSERHRQGFDRALEVYVEYGRNYRVAAGG